MGVFDKAKDMYALQRQAKQIKEELKKIHIEAETNPIKLTVDGEQHFISTEIVAEMDPDLKKKIEKAFVDAANKAIKKSQQIGAEKMKAVMGGMMGM